MSPVPPPRAFAPPLVFVIALAACASSDGAAHAPDARAAPDATGPLAADARANSDAKEPVAVDAGAPSDMTGPFAADARADANAAGPLAPDAPAPSPAWEAAPGWHIEELVAASGPEEAALAYIEAQDGAPHQRRLLLQRVDGAGTPLGVPRLLATSGRALALATNGRFYLACWEEAAEIACARAGVGSDGSLVTGPRVSGRAPALAASEGAGGTRFALATFEVTDGAVSLRSFDERLAPRATPQVVLGDPAAQPGPHERPLLVASRAGFALVGGDPLRARAFDVDLAARGPAVDLGLRFWRHSAAVALGDGGEALLVSVSQPYRAELVLVGAGRVSSKAVVAGGGKTGLNLALRAHGGGAALAWLECHDGVAAERSIPGADIEAGALPGFETRCAADVAPLALVRVGGRPPLLFGLGRSGEVRRFPL